MATKDTTLDQDIEELRIARDYLSGLLSSYTVINQKYRLSEEAKDAYASMLEAFADSMVLADELEALKRLVTQ